MDNPHVADGELDLDVTIVAAARPDAALLSSTDDGCDTRKDGDC